MDEKKPRKPSIRTLPGYFSSDSSVVESAVSTPWTPQPLPPREPLRFNSDGQPLGHDGEIITPSESALGIAQRIRAQEEKLKLEAVERAALYKPAGAHRPQSETWEEEIRHKMYAERKLFPELVAMGDMPKTGATVIGGLIDGIIKQGQPNKSNSWNHLQSHRDVLQEILDGSYATAMTTSAENRQGLSEDERAAMATTQENSSDLSADERTQRWLKKVQYAPVSMADYLNRLRGSVALVRGRVEALDMPQDIKDKTIVDYEFAVSNLTSKYIRPRVEKAIRDGDLLPGMEGHASSLTLSVSGRASG